MKTIAVASGKGGVGKTTLTANLGVALASLGQRVVLFDADLGLANLDVVLGLKPEVTIQHVIQEIVPMAGAAIEGPGGIRVINGGSGIGSMLRLSRKRLATLISQVAELRETTDFVIFDSASGADARVMTVLKSADEAILVATPEPASLVDCYSTAKVLFRHKKDAEIGVVVNMVEDTKQAQKAFDIIRSAAKRFLHKPVHYLGCVRADLAAADIARTRQPFVLAAPHLVASTDITRLAEALVREASIPIAQGVPVQARLRAA